MNVTQRVWRYRMQRGLQLRYRRMIAEVAKYGENSGDFWSLSHVDTSNPASLPIPVFVQIVSVR